MNDCIAMLIAGSMLLVSIAAATGNGNQVSVDIYQETEGNCITGDVYIAQETYAIAYVLGNNNYVSQAIDAYANDNT